MLLPSVFSGVSGSVVSVMSGPVPVGAGVTVLEGAGEQPATAAATKLLSTDRLRRITAHPPVS